MKGATSLYPRRHRRWETNSSSSSSFSIPAAPADPLSSPPTWRHTSISRQDKTACSRSGEHREQRASFALVLVPVVGLSRFHLVVGAAKRSLHHRIRLDLDAGLSLSLPAAARYRTRIAPRTSASVHPHFIRDAVCASARHPLLTSMLNHPPRRRVPAQSSEVDSQSTVRLIKHAGLTPVSHPFAGAVLARTGDRTLLSHPMLMRVRILRVDRARSITARRCTRDEFRCWRIPYFARREGTHVTSHRHTTYIQTSQRTSTTN